MKQPWESDVSLGTKSLSDASAPKFPPPPLAPIRPNRRQLSHDSIPPIPAIRPRSTLPQNRSVTPASRFSSDSDASSVSSIGTRSAGGLRPPPLRRSFRASMAPIPGSPIDETDKTSAISPILSGALGIHMPPKAVTPSPPSDDVIPDEHKRVPGLIPRSPLSPISVSLGFMAKRAVRKPVPEPIVVQMPSRAKFDVASPGLESIAIASPTVEQKKPKRKTMWGFVEGWWDLGLIDRMGTVRRKKQPAQI